MQFVFDQRRSDREVAAVDVIDQDGNAQQKENTVQTSLAWRLVGCRNSHGRKAGQCYTMSRNFILHFINACGFYRLRDRGQLWGVHSAIIFAFQIEGDVPCATYSKQKPWTK